MQHQPDAVIVTVCKAGGEFRPRHATDLCDQIRRHNPDLNLLMITLTDFRDWLGGSGQRDSPTTPLPLEFGLPGWWSVLEAFRAPLALHTLGFRLPVGTQFVYLDLDTVCIGSLRSLLDELDRQPFDRLACLRDIYRQDRPEMGVMGWRSPLTSRSIGKLVDRVLDFEPDNPPSVWLRAHAGWQLVMFDRWLAGVWSYKHDLRDAPKFAGRIPAEPPVPPGLVVFHGKPRPWHVGGEAGIRALMGQEAVADGA